MLETFKNTVANTLNVDLDDESRKRDLFEARIVFVMICLGNHTAKKIPTNKALGELLWKRPDLIVYYKKQAKNLMIYNEFKSKYVKCLEAIGKSKEEISILTSKEFIEKITKKRK